MLGIVDGVVAAAGGGLEEAEEEEGGWWWNDHAVWTRGAGILDMWMPSSSGDMAAKGEGSVELVVVAAAAGWLGPLVCCVFVGGTGVWSGPYAERCEVVER